MSFQDEHQQMKSRFPGHIRRSAFLFCVAFNAFAADTPSTASRNNHERLLSIAQAEINDSKSVLIDTEQIKGQHEYHTEARSENELRTGPIISADRLNSNPDDKAAEKSVSMEEPGKTSENMQAKPKQDYTLSPAVKNVLPLKAPIAGTKNTEGVPVVAGIEHIPGHIEQEGEARLRGGALAGQAAPSDISSPTLKNENKLAIPNTEAEANKNRSVFIEAERIHGHLTQEGDTKLRLGGAIAPYEVPSLALKDENKGPVPITTAEKKKTRPIFIAADRLEGHVEEEIEGIGKAELFNGDQFISADRMKYHQVTEDAEAQGSVRVERNGDILEGSQLKFNLASKTGQLSQPTYRLKDASSRGYANMVLFEGENQYRLRQATYTTCPAGDNDWYMQADDLEINNTKKAGIGQKVKLTFKDVPILYTPWINFSFSGERKSGFLAPLYGYTARTGIDLTVPFYWNIAPNYDATFSTRAMSQRGVAMNSEFRYLGTSSNANLVAEILPNDLKTKESRYRVSFGHNQILGNGFYSRLDYNRVSDDTYFRDLGNNLNVTSRVNLLQQGLLAYNRNLGGDGRLNVTTLVQQFQTIQDPLAQVVAPYKRLPQVTLTANKPDILGADFNLISSWTNFSHPTLVSGNRVTLFPSVSYPMRNAFGYITPKIGIHHTEYYLDPSGSSQSNDPTRTLPIFSVDSSVMFDRRMELGGEKFTQTLEPRLFYVYVPFRDQSLLPNFDSAKTDFSFAQMLTENRFSGSDRINDANQVSFALTSRLIEPGSGKERLRVSIGQQFSFINRQITLDAPGTIPRRPDAIAAFTGFITPTITTDSSMQFDQAQYRAEVVRSGLSYRPEPGRVVNVGYRYTRDVLHQVDFSSQWRWAERWQSVARLNYSLQDRTILEGLAGIEYNACCWSLRFVVQHLTLATQKTTTAAFLQLELNGLMQIGSNPLQVLQRSIPGYTQIGSQGSGAVGAQ
jgi:LPS-assembly protein